MRAEIVPFHVDLSADAGLEDIQGDRLMIIPGDDEEIGVVVQGQPAYIYMPEKTHPQHDEETIFLLAGNIQVSWTVEEWIKLVPKIDALIQKGRQEWAVEKQAAND